MVLGMILAATLAQSHTLPPVLDEVSKRAVRYFWENTHADTGLALDRAPNSGTPPDMREPERYIVASIASTGYSLCAFAIGSERGWLPRDQVVKRTRKGLHWIHDHALKDHGWYYHFIDWRNGKRIWNSEVSSIDTGLLLGGIMMIEPALKDREVTEVANQIIKEIDWKWMLTDGGKNTRSLTLSMSYDPEHGFNSYRWDQYFENIFLNIMALGASDEIPDESWRAIRRHFVSYKGSNLITGGPLFMHEMSTGFFDFTGKRDMFGIDYWVNSRHAILANRQWCIDNPGHFAGYSPTIWGLNACDTPDGYRAPGAPNLGTNEDDGTVMPSAVAGAVCFTPDESIASAEAFRAKFPTGWGKYGFANGINPGKNWIDPDVIGIDLGMVLLGIENYRDNLPHRLMMSNPIAVKGMQRAGFHTTDEGPLEKRPLVLMR